MPGIDELVKTDVYQCFPKAEGGWGRKTITANGHEFWGAGAQNVLEIYCNDNRSL